MPKCDHLNGDNINETVKKLKDGFAINGCCGGGCFVIHSIVYCPFCGKKIFQR